jgi:hypothetical protein
MARLIMAPVVTNAAHKPAHEMIGMPVGKRDQFRQGFGVAPANRLVQSLVVIVLIAMLAFGDRLGGAGGQRQQFRPLPRQPSRPCVGGEAYLRQPVPFQRGPDGGRVAARSSQQLPTRQQQEHFAQFTSQLILMGVGQEAEIRRLVPARVGFDSVIRQHLLADFESLIEHLSIAQLGREKHLGGANLCQRVGAMRQGLGALEFARQLDDALLANRQGRERHHQHQQRGVGDGQGRRRARMAPTPLPQPFDDRHIRRVTQRPVGQVAFQVLAQVRRAGVAILGIGRQQLHDHRVDRRRDQLVPPAGRIGIAPPHLEQGEGRVRGSRRRQVVRIVTSQQLEQNHAQRIQIGSRVDMGIPVDHRLQVFGGHVGHRAAEVSGLVAGI